MMNKTVDTLDLAVAARAALQALDDLMRNPSDPTLVNKLNNARMLLRKAIQ